MSITQVQVINAQTGAEIAAFPCQPMARWEFQKMFDFTFSPGNLFKSKGWHIFGEESGITLDRIVSHIAVVELDLS